ncbi:hypothetical protein NDU88_012118 [Pleurodeles waltl]|uniref:Uncharacterized protein n=1 Tax=Pleurodeles waltl TaxID=8319 RepID=A0AAV7R5A7_PLEWA|nr:hypothetical protein NDU88_012118 [Pleurodeles waltl]
MPFLPRLSGDGREGERVTPARYEALAADVFQRLMDTVLDGIVGVQAFQDVILRLRSAGWKTRTRCYSGDLRGNREPHEPHDPGGGLLLDFCCRCAFRLLSGFPAFRLRGCGCSPAPLLPFSGRLAVFAVGPRLEEPEEPEGESEGGLLPPYADYVDPRRPPQTSCPDQVPGEQTRRRPGGDWETGRPGDRERLGDRMRLGETG